MNRVFRLCIFTFGVALAVGTNAAADQITVGGVTRTFASQLPQAKPAPLVIVLHGNTQTGADMASRTSWPAMAKRERFGVVFPDGLNRAWADFRPNANRAGRAPPKGTDDVAFIVALIEKFVADGSADAKRIFVTGVSNGGAMTMTLVCAHAELFAAAASVIMNLTDESAAACHPFRPVPMLLMNGTADPLIPYEGGRGTSRFAVAGFWSTAKTLDFWRRVNGCEAQDADVSDLDDTDRGDQSTVTRIASRCPPGRDVLLYRVNHGGHRMPGALADARFPRMVDAFRPAKSRRRRRRNHLGVFPEVSVSASAFGKNLFNILPPVEHTDDFRPIVFQTIEHNLGAGGERAQSRPDFIARPSCKGKSSMVATILATSRKTLSAVTRPAVPA